MKKIPEYSCIYGRRYGSENQISCIVDDSIKFSVIVPLYNTPEKYLGNDTISYLPDICKLGICLADGSDSEHAYIEDICMKYAKGQ